MPIYAYRCEACGFAKDVLQKMSDPKLTDCPECGKDTFKKQLTAAGFQLKGTGWYATDFRGGAATNAPPAAQAEPAKSGDTAAAAAPATATPAPAAAAATSAVSTKSDKGGSTPSAT
ncbi:MAG: putative FmdB family regulatory protein [Bradyrhizobium sp.]|jgi:putative FmdB family regulatory protein